MNNNMKMPISDCMHSLSMLVPHDPAVNDAIASQGVDKGLKPNGLTIDLMRENPEFYANHDTLDRAAIAANESGKVADQVKKVVRSIKSAETDRNKTPKFI